MTRPDYTDITFILDRSGSMASMTTEPYEAFNAFVQKQAGEEGKCSFTTILFDHEYEFWSDKGIPVKEVPLMTSTHYVPRGTTALLDSVGRAIKEVGERFAKMAEEDRPSKVIIVTLTDGLENASREYSRGQIKELIKTQTIQFNWSFVFLGAHADSFTEVMSIGVMTANYAKFDCDTEGDLLRSVNVVSSNVANYRSTGQGSQCLASDS